jgi:hypothetical protein
LLASTGWVGRTRAFATSLRRARAGHEPDTFLMVGTPTHEPWHLTAHLTDEARWFDLPELAPTLVRWAPPENAPPHLAVGLSRLEQVRRGETVMIVAPDDATEPLLERVADARRSGATVFSLDGSGGELSSLAHETLIVPPHGGEDIVVPGRFDVPPMSFELATHLVSAAAGEADDVRRRGFRDRLGRMLDAINGGTTDTSED